MATGFAPTDELPARGVIAPPFMALGIAAGILDLYVDPGIALAGSWVGHDGIVLCPLHAPPVHSCRPSITGVPWAAMQAMNKRIDLGAAEARFRARRV
jgi:hypothetical protein